MIIVPGVVDTKKRGEYNLYPTLIHRHEVVGTKPHSAIVHRVLMDQSQSVQWSAVIGVQISPPPKQQDSVYLLRLLLVANWRFDCNSES